MSISKNLTFILSFNQQWVLRKNLDENILPVDQFLDEFEKQYHALIVGKDFTECEIVVTDPSGIDSEVLRHDILTHLNKLFSLEPDSSVFELEIRDDSGIIPDENIIPTEHLTDPPSDDEKKNEEEKPSEPEKVNTSQTGQNGNTAFIRRPISREKIQKSDIVIKAKTAHRIKTASDKAEELIGAADFKALAKEIRTIAPIIKKYDTYEAITNRCYLVSINDGCGLSTYLELFADLLAETELFKFNPRGPRVNEVKLGPQQKEPMMDNPFSAALACFGATASGKVVCIDISEWMTNTNDKEFREFLQTVSSRGGENIVFFRVPFVENNVLRDLHRSLNYLLFIKSLSIVPFDAEELDQFAAKILSEKGFEISDNAWKIYHERITEEKTDGHFYGINTVNKVILEMIYRKQLFNAENGGDDTVIKREEITGLSENENSMELTGMEMLDELVGVEDIKKKVEEIIAQITARVGNETLGSPCIHMRFVGNPGTGKTTVARIIGKILKEKGILRNGSFFEYSGRDFCGRFVGQTAPKTAAMCRDAYGSVLFIDEAYSLYRDDSISTADYGREALDTLVAEMENHRSDLMVIMAGYPDEMEKLMKGNTGLLSRMPYQIDFPNYSKEQLSDIFLSMAKKSFSYDEDFENTVREYFNNLSDELMKRKDFSNARYVRNLYERTWGKAVLRCQMAGQKCTQLLSEDFNVAASEKDFANMNSKKSKTIGFI